MHFEEPCEGDESECEKVQRVEECVSRKSESTMSTKKVIQESRELNRELAGLIAERESLMSKLMDLDKVLEREEETIAPLSTTSKAVESLNSPAMCESTTGPAVESSNSPAMPIVVVTKAPAVEDEANYIIVEEDAISKVYFELPEDLRDKYHDEASGSEDELAEDLNLAFHGYANLMENHVIGEMLMRYDGAASQSTCDGHTKYINGVEVFQKCTVRSNFIFWEIKNFPRYRIRCPEVRWDGKCLRDLFFENPDPIDGFLFVQYLCSTLPYKKCCVHMQVFICFHLDPLVQFFTVEHEVFENKSTVYRMHSRVIREIEKWLKNVHKEKYDFLHKYSDFQFLDFYLHPFWRSKMNIEYLYNYEEIVAGTSFRSARSYFDTFDDIDTSDMSGGDYIYMHHRDLCESDGPEQSRKRKRYSTWRRKDRPDTESNASESDASEPDAEECNASVNE